MKTHLLPLFLLSLILLPGCENTGAPGNINPQSPVRLVEPLTDAANSRWFFFNSASQPFGMVNLSPDMIISGAWNSGYRYNHDTIRGEIFYDTDGIFERQRELIRVCKNCA
ncbi:MAG: hypothetical protein R6U86_10130, partial [Bacteroidales bacterium]